MRSSCLAVALVLMVATAACRSGWTSGEQRTNHAVVIENRSGATIYNVQIVYGVESIPRGSQREMGPGGPTGGGLHWDARMAIPETVVVVWRSADDKTHRVNIPMKHHFPDAATFTGEVVFRIHDDGVRVSVKRRTPQGPWAERRIY